jgi:hypothetical protein
MKSKQERQRVLREERTEQAKAQEGVKREQIAVKLAEKEAKAAAVRTERSAERTHGKVEKRLQSQARSRCCSSLLLLLLLLLMMMMLLLLLLMLMFLPV